MDGVVNIGFTNVTRERRGGTMPKGVEPLEPLFPKKPKEGKKMDYSGLPFSKPGSSSKKKKKAKKEEAKDE